MPSLSINRHRASLACQVGGERIGDGLMITTDFVACYQDHYRSIVRSLRLAGADPATAEDLTQEAFAASLAHWTRVRRGANPAGYVYLTAFRMLRRAERRNRMNSPMIAATAADPVGRNATTTVSVEAALAGMPPRRRQCAVICLLLGFSPAEAAKILGIAAGTVRKHLNDARQELQTACDPRQETPL